MMSLVALFVRLQLNAIIIPMIFASNDERGTLGGTRDLRNCLLTYNNIPFKCEIIVEWDSERTESFWRARAIVVN